MAVVEVQFFDAPGSVSASTLVATVPAAGVAAGDFLVASAVASAGRTLSSVVDSKANTWVVHGSAVNATTATASFASCKVTTPLVSGDTITLTYNLAAVVAVRFFDYTGFDPAGHFDAISAGNTGAVAACDGGPVTTTLAGDFVMGCIGYSGAATTITPSAGYVDEGQVSSTGTVRSVRTVSKTAGAAGSETAGGTLAVAKTWAGLTIAFKVAAGGTTPVTVTPAAASVVFAASAAATAATVVVPTAADAVFSAAGSVTASPVVAGTAAATFTASAAAAAPTVVVPVAATSVFGASAVVTTPGSVTASSRLPLAGVGT